MNRLGLLGAAAAGVILMSGSAQAATTYHVDVWTGAPDGVSSSTSAADPGPTGLASASFDFTGPINWYVGPPQNTSPSGNLFGQFIPAGGISSFVSPRGTYTSLAGFLGDSMSIAGDSYASFFRIAGNYSGSGVTGSITHDDGATVYDYLHNAVYSSPGETSAVTGNFNLPSGPHTFSVDYVEGNGSPSVLNFAVTAVPEPATWALMLTGFFGAGMLVRKRRRALAAA